MIKQFPDFTSLTTADREEYMKFARNYPPISDLSFTTFMIWWNFDDTMQVSQLNGNLVISYYLPGDEVNSGWALIGTNKVQESCKEIFTELAAHNKEVRLVHVPEFVVDSLKNADFLITEERDYDEYLFLTDSLYPLENLDHNTRRKVKKFITDAGEENISVDSLNLENEADQDLLLSTIAKWREQSEWPNDRDGIEMEVLPTSIRRAEELGMKNICLYVGGEMVGTAIFQISYDQQYLIYNHAKVKPGIRRASDYLAYEVARWAMDHNIARINMEMDLGITGLRIHKSELKPVDFFRKYEIRPIQS